MSSPYRRNAKQSRCFSFKILSSDFLKCRIKYWKTVVFTFYDSVEILLRTELTVHVRQHKYKVILRLFSISKLSVSNWVFQKINIDWSCSSVIGHLLNLYKALGFSFRNITPTSKFNVTFAVTKINRISMPFLICSDQKCFLQELCIVFFIFMVFWVCVSWELSPGL